MNYPIIRTPLIPCFEVESELTANIYLKPENLQPFGSYKIRGIDALFRTFSERDLPRGISAASAGNMGQSLAYMAAAHGMPCKIYVPETAPEVKKIRIQKAGAQVVELPFNTLWHFITNPPITTNDMLFVHPVHTEALLAGYEAIAYEIIADLPEVEAIVIPLGIGGLAMAISRVIKKIKPNVMLYVCEPETAAPFKAARVNGKPTRIKPQPSFVDAIGSPELLPYVFEQLSPLIEDSVVVSIADTQKALRSLLFNNKILVEGAGACSLAAAIQLAKCTSYKIITCILTGGNLPMDQMSWFNDA